MEQTIDYTYNVISPVFFPPDYTVDQHVNARLLLTQGEGAAVLLRSLEPLQGLEAMRELRSARRKENARLLKDKELCNGPSKLCQALDIQRGFDRRDLASDHEVWLEQGPESPTPETVVSAPRIGINYAGEWVSKPLRFYIQGNSCVSVVDKAAERASST